MALTRRDFELLAETLKDSKPAPGPGLPAAHYYARKEQHEWTVRVLANRLRATNPRFDIERFIAACGVS